MASGIVVLQGSDAWHQLREKRFSGSEIYNLIGLGSRIDPQFALNNKLSPEEHSKDTLKFFAHGHKFETQGLAICIDIMAKKGLRQAYTLPSGYYVPSPSNMNFLAPGDSERFGVSLDGEGSTHDIEVKNPYTLGSFYRNYERAVQFEHFIQCQWAMAIRERSSMFFVATSFDAQSSLFLAIVIWQVKFSPEFFTEVIYPKAHAAYKHFEEGTPSDLPWLNDNNKFANSKRCKELFSSHCIKIHSHEERQNTDLLKKIRTP